MRAEPANVFELDRGMSALLRGPRGEQLRPRGRVASFRFGRGTVDFDPFAPSRGWGLIVLEGFFTRQVELAGRTTTELLGAGDVLRPWDEPHAEGSVPLETSWRAISPSRVGLLDARFMAAVSPFPEVTDILSSRLSMHSRWASLLLIVARLPWTEGRILVLFWHLADRWGRVLPTGGVLVPLSLTHSEIGELVSTLRPRTTMALNSLVKMGAISRHDEGWILHGLPPSPGDLEREALAKAFRVRRSH